MKPTAETPAPYWACDYATLYAGDSLSILRGLPTASVDARGGPRE